ncbi:MAG: hypothetical protein WAM30_18035 [Candidatus Dormiibacterota bacterium]
MTPAEELRHLLQGAGADEAPARLDELTGDCPAGAPRALGRARDVLRVVLEHQTGPWPDLDRWQAMLPAWFVEACVDDRRVRNCVLDRWSLRAWLHWLQPDQRQWRWWDARPVDETHLRVQLLPAAETYLRGSLEWLLTVAGR